MRSPILAFALGVFLLQRQGQLWPWWSYAMGLALPVGLVFLWISKLTWIERIKRTLTECSLFLRMLFRLQTLMLALLVGHSWAGLFAHYRLQENLADDVVGQDMEVVGVIKSLPTRSAQGWHFQFELESVQGKKELSLVPHRIAMSWFDHPENPTAFSSLNAGQRWQMIVRLKPIHGNANPNGFDYEAWMLEQGIGASGIVRLRAGDNRRPAGLPATEPIDPAAEDGFVPRSKGPREQYVNAFTPRKLDEFVFGVMNTIERSRSILRERLHRALNQGADRPYAGVLVALVIGDQSEIPQSQWALFNRTGIGHLVSISGLHITMIAGLFAALGAYLWRRSAFIGRDWPLLLPVRKVAVLCAAVAALLYVALAGFGVPAQRTLLMLAVVAFAVWTDRGGRPSEVLCLALGLVLLFDPWAVLWTGFYLSFVAVAVLMYASTPSTQPFSAPSALDGVEPEIGSNSKSESSQTTNHRAQLRWWRTRYESMIAMLGQAARAQYAVTLGLVPLSLLLFSQISLLSPIANAIAIPLVSFVVTPLALIGSVLPTEIAAVALNLAHGCFTYLMQLLGFLSQSSIAVWHLPQPNWWMFVLAVVGALCLLAPKAWPMRGLGLVFCLPMLTQSVTHPALGQFRVLAFDVGQGTAVLIETEHHRLLYDTGPGASDESNSGLRIILPYLQARGITRLDEMMISHADADHSGGAISVLGGVEVQRVRSSLDLDHEIVQRALSSATNVQQSDRHLRCTAGQVWNWDGIHFEIVHPVPVIYTSAKWKTNARSCTLRISNANQSLLLTGDIEAVQEDELLNSIPEKLAATVLMVPHHGSGTSSTLDFVKAVAPQYALYQFGYMNRYHHPQPAVWQRYLDFGVIPLRTAVSGAIALQFADTVTIEHYRQVHRRYWYPK